MINNYTKAVELAKAKSEEGYKYLYENTYKEKYFVALKYMRNSEDAKDVLQEAYLIGFSKLDMLEKPESFPSWIGQIVANTAKNVLQKRNQEVVANGVVNKLEGDDKEYQVEDETIQNQPEKAFIQQETKEIVQELIDSLPDKQKQCINMFYMEGMSIQEIAKILECSENTVKSRLTYGRKKFKSKMFALQEKGVQIFSITPSSVVLQFIERKKKLIASILKVAVVSGAGVMLVACNHSNVEKEEIVTTGEEVIVDMTEMATTQEATTEAVWMDVSDDQYEKLLQGNLRKDQFEYILAYGPEEMKDSVVDLEKMKEMIFNMCQFVNLENPEITVENSGVDAQVNLSVAEINNMFSVLTDYTFSEDKNSELVSKGDNMPGVNIAGDVMSIVISTPNYYYNTNIISAKYSGDDMVVEYEVSYGAYEYPGQIYSWNKRTAYLKKQSSGLYQVDKIIPEENETWKTMYKRVITDIQSENPFFDVTSSEYLANYVITGYQYSLTDITGDGIPELFIGVSTDMATVYKVYSVDGNKLIEIEGELFLDLRSRLVLSNEGNELLQVNGNAYSPDEYIYKVTLGGNSISTEELKVIQWDTQEGEDFDNTVHNLTVTDLTDLTQLEE